MSKETKNNDNEPKQTFEQSLEQLEQIIGRIEAGEVTLEESLAQYEQGTKLIKHCRSVLEQAEQKIKQLTISDDGEVTE